MLDSANAWYGRQKDSQQRCGRGRGVALSMKICFVAVDLQHSGGVRCIVEYANRLTERGHEVYLVTSALAADQADLLHVSADVEILEASRAADRRGLLRNGQLAWELLSLVPRCDVVIATYTPSVPIALLAARKHQGCVPVWFCQDYQEQFAGRPVESLLYNVAARLFPSVLCVSDANAAELPLVAGKPRPIVTVVREGLSDRDLLRPGEPNLRRRAEVLYVGDNRPRKGLRELLLALEAVRQLWPEVRLVVVSKENVNALLETACPIPYRFLHRPDSATLAGLYASCGVFVSASWAEGFGLPPLEAMACGAPVVLTDSRGVRDYARHEENCLLVPARDPQPMAMAISRLMRDPMLADSLGARGIETAARYSWEEAVGRFEGALREVIAR
ncbi:MAG: glycosyltransferase family 4 protein [Chloroflexota bacterium]